MCKVNPGHDDETAKDRLEKFTGETIFLAFGRGDCLWPVVDHQHLRGRKNCPRVLLFLAIPNALASIG